MQTAILVVAVSCQIPQIPVSVKRAIQSGIKRHADWRSEGCNIITGNWWRCHSWLLVKRLLKTKEIIYFRRTVRVHSAWKMCRSWLSLKVHEKAVLFWRRKSLSQVQPDQPKQYLTACERQRELQQARCQRTCSRYTVCSPVPQAWSINDHSYVWLLLGLQESFSWWHQAKNTCSTGNRMGLVVYTKLVSYSLVTNANVTGWFHFSL